MRECGLWTIAIVAAALSVGCRGEPKDVDDLTFLDMHEALVQPGKVFYAEFELSPEGSQRPSYRMWYSAVDGISRSEYFSDLEVLRSTEIITLDREVSFNWTDNHLSDEAISAPQVKRPIPIAAGPLRAYFGPATPKDGVDGFVTTESYHGIEEIDGRIALHLRATIEALEDGHERPKGTKFTFDVYFDAITHFPVRSEMRVSYPDQAPGLEALVVTFTRAELIAASSLPPGHFDPDLLSREELTLDEAVALAARSDFAIFWLGRAVGIDWVARNGTRYSAAELAEVEAPGVAGRSSREEASLSYSMPPDFFGPMLTLTQSTDPIRVEPRDIEAIRAAGNVTRLSGLDGYIYAQYSSRGNCSFAAAQSDPACRMFADAVYGAVVTLKGTTIHLAAIRLQSQGDTGPNDNPFSDREILLRLVGELRPIGE